MNQDRTMGVSQEQAQRLLNHVRNGDMRWEDAWRHMYPEDGTYDFDRGGQWGQLRALNQQTPRITLSGKGE